MADIVNLIAIKDGKILVIKRRKDPYKWMYGLPWWHVEQGETKSKALRREIWEETKQTLKNLRYIRSVSDNVNETNIHLYKATVVWDALFEIDDEWVEEVKRLVLSKFIKNLETFTPIGREKLLMYLK